MTIDFTTALARLLRDGRLRDRFSRDPEAVCRELGVSPEDEYAICGIPSAQLEVQAEVLLRKQFAHVKNLLPATCRHLGDDAVDRYRRGARGRVLDASSPRWREADFFLQELRQTSPESIADSDVARVEFLKSSERLKVCWNSNLWARGSLRKGWQILWRTRRGHFREVALYLSL